MGRRTQSRIAHKTSVCIVATTLSADNAAVAGPRLMLHGITIGKIMRARLFIFHRRLPVSP
jgi:hypothetical protein